MSASAQKSAAVKAHRERNATAKATTRPLGDWKRQKIPANEPAKRRAVDDDFVSSVDRESYESLRVDAGLSPRTACDTEPDDPEHYVADNEEQEPEGSLLVEMAEFIMATNVKPVESMSPAWKRFLNELHATLHAAGRSLGQLLARTVWRTLAVRRPYLTKVHN